MPSYSVYGHEEAEVLSAFSSTREWPSSHSGGQGLSSHSCRNGNGASPPLDFNFGCNSNSNSSGFPGNSNGNQRGFPVNQHQQMMIGDESSGNKSHSASHQYFQQHNSSALDQFNATDYFGSMAGGSSSDSWMGSGGLARSLTASKSETVIPFINSSSGISREKWLEYMNRATKMSFIVGMELERVKEKSRHNNSQSFCRISAHFKNKYGETDSKTKAAYLQIGVRVPTKEHVSEIVGKGGSKIKTLREETGALITTPGENEDHVFIIEAPPEIAFKVGHLIRSKAEEITQNKSTERRRGSGGTFTNRVMLARDRISVPQEMVGKIIGTQGSIITTIQKDTGTEIKSPPKEPVLAPSGSGKDGQGASADFEIAAYQSANLQCVEAAENRIRQAKQLICHLVMRQLERREEEEAASCIDGGDSGRGSQTDHELISGGERSPSGDRTGSPVASWMWPDVVQMDSKEAREVIDRILQESKNKTKKTAVLGKSGSGDGDAFENGTTESPELSRMDALVFPGGMQPHRGSFSGPLGGDGGSESPLGSEAAMHQFMSKQYRPWDPNNQFRQQRTNGSSQDSLSFPSASSSNSGLSRTQSTPWSNGMGPGPAYFFEPILSMYGENNSASALRRSTHGSLDRISGPNNAVSDDAANYMDYPSQFHGQRQLPQQAPRTNNVPYFEDYLSRDMNRLNMGSNPDFFGNATSANNNSRDPASSFLQSRPSQQQQQAQYHFNNFNANNFGFGNNELSRTMSDTPAANLARKMGRPPVDNFNGWPSSTSFDQELLMGDNSMHHHLPSGNSVDPAAAWRNFPCDESNQFDLFPTDSTTALHGSADWLIGLTSATNSVSGSASGDAAANARVCGIIGDRRKRNTPSPPLNQLM